MESKVCDFKEINSYALFKLPMTDIQLDSIGTWPKKIVDELTKHKTELYEYIQTEKRIDHQAETNIEYRINRPLNSEASVYNSMLNIISEEMTHKSIAGYHASKILPYEKANILNNGLNVLTESLVNLKLNYLVDNEIIPDYVYSELLEKNLSNAFNRKNQVCLFHTKRTMKSSSGLHKLLGIYGGESLYWSHLNNPKILSFLKSIGNASIIFCQLGYEEIADRHNISERMIEFFITQNDFEDFDSFNHHMIKVNRIIDIYDEEFEQLTNFKNWQK